MASLGVPYVCMHMRGTPQTMQTEKMTAYEDVCTEVACELQARAEQAMLAGIAGWNIILDPGIETGSMLLGQHGFRNCLTVIMVQAGDSAYSQMLQL